jgi:hypothetical protein
MADVEREFITDLIRLIKGRVEQQISYVKVPSGDTLEEISLTYVERVSRIREAEEIGEELCSLYNAYFSTNVKYDEKGKQK